jgi:hypothetical protein
MMKKSVTKNSHLKETIHNFIIAPVLSGPWGYTIFFSTMILAKGLGNLVGSLPAFNIEIADTEMPILGFILLFLIRFIKNFAPDNDRKKVKYL